MNQPREKPKEKPAVRHPQLHHAAIYAESLDRSIAFYEAALGLAVEARWTTISVGGGGEPRPLIGAFLADPTGRVIEVFQRPTGAKPPEDERPINHFAFQVPDVEVVFKRALAAGATEVNPPTRARTGKVSGKAAFVRGPDGERIELVRFDSV